MEFGGHENVLAMVAQHSVLNTTEFHTFFYELKSLWAIEKKLIP